MFVQKKKILLALLCVCWFLCCSIVSAAEQTERQTVGDNERMQLFALLCKRPLESKVQEAIRRVGVNTPLVLEPMMVKSVPIEIPKFEELGVIVRTLLDGRMVETVPIPKDIYFEAGDRPIHIAVRLKNRTLLRCCLAQPDLNIDSQNARGQTCLHLAAAYFSEAIEMIVLRDPNIAIQDEKGNVPLHYRPRQVFSLYMYADKCQRAKSENEVRAVVTYWIRETAPHSPYDYFPEYIFSILKKYHQTRWDPSKIKNKAGVTPEEGWKRSQLYFVLDMPEESPLDSYLEFSSL